MITQGMWQMLSELLDGEKLTDSLNKVIYDLCDGKAVVAYELTDEEIIDAWEKFPNWGHGQHIVMFGRDLLKKASEK